VCVVNCCEHIGLVPGDDGPRASPPPPFHCTPGAPPLAHTTAAPVCPGPSIAQLLLWLEAAFQGIGGASAVLKFLTCICLRVLVALDRVDRARGRPPPGGSVQQAARLDRMGPNSSVRHVCKLLLLLLLLPVLVSRVSCVASEGTWLSSHYRARDSEMLLNYACSSAPAPADKAWRARAEQPPRGAGERGANFRVELPSCCRRRPVVRRR
jgi:hypothetical protein